MINMFSQTINLADIEISPKDRKEIESILHHKANKIEIKRLQFGGCSVEKGEGDRTIKAYITTNAKDRVGEIIDPAGGDLAVYLKQPRLLWNHDYSIPAIGRSQWLKLNTKGIISCFEFAMTQFAAEIYDLYDKKFINTFSVGFMVLPGGYDEETKTFKKWHLLEVSGCNIPCNPEAEIVTDDELAKAGIIIQTKSLREALHIIDKQVPPPPPVEEPGTENFTTDAEKPYPNEHACRLNDPGKYDKLRRGTRDHEGKTYSIIFGHPKDGGGWEEQAYRYKKSEWTAAEARVHCKSHEGKFEAASSEASVPCPACGDRFEEAEEKIFDLEGNPSVSDIMEAVRMAACATYPGQENVGPGAQYISVYIQELYPVDYPDGEVVIAVYDKEKITHYFLYDYSFADGKATLGDKPLEVTVGYRRRSRKSSEQWDLARIFDEMRVVRDEIVDAAKTIVIKKAETEISDPPKKDVVTINLADIDAMHKPGEGEPKAVEFDVETVKQAVREVLASQSLKIDAGELIVNEIDRRLGRMK